MANDDYRPKQSPFNIIRVGHLPFGVSAKEISMMFEPFGMIQNLYLKRRVARDSQELLKNPFVILIFDNPESVNHIMASRPLYMGDCLLFIRRFMPITPQYPNDGFFAVRKILVRVPSTEENDQILPDDQTIVEYLSIVHGNIVYFERLDDKTVLIQFDDYDPVDLCCLLRPHFINEQAIEIEKCSDEKQVRDQIESKRKLNFISTEPFVTTTTTTVDNHSEIMNTTSPTPILSIDDQMSHVRLSYQERTSRLEREHEQLVTTLSEEWKQTARERIRLERLTKDYKIELEQILEENRKWQKLYSESLKEKPIVQNEGEQQLNEISQAYEQLMQNKPSGNN